MIPTSGRFFTTTVSANEQAPDWLQSITSTSWFRRKCRISALPSLPFQAGKSAIRRSLNSCARANIKPSSPLNMATVGMVVCFGWNSPDSYAREPSCGLGADPKLVTVNCNRRPDIIAPHNPAPEY